MRLRPQSLERRREARRAQKLAKPATASSGRSPKGRRYGLAMSTPEGTVTLRIPALRRNRPPRTVYVGSYEDKLSRLAAMRVSPDDDGRTREDKELEQREGRPPTSGGGTIGIS